MNFLIKFFTFVLKKWLITNARGAGIDEWELRIRYVAWSNYMYYYIEQVQSFFF